MTLRLRGTAVGLLFVAGAIFVLREGEPVFVPLLVSVSTLVAMREGNLVSPWLTGRAGELNTVAVFVSVLFWGWMWGIWGLLLAVPIMVSLEAAADHLDPLQPVGELLGR